MVKSIGDKWAVRCTEVVCFSGGLLLEVLLYICGRIMNMYYQEAWARWQSLFWVTSFIGVKSSCYVCTVSSLVNRLVWKQRNGLVATIYYWVSVGKALSICLLIPVWPTMLCGKDDKELIIEFSSLLECKSEWCNSSHWSYWWPQMWWCRLSNFAFNIWYSVS